EKTHSQRLYLRQPALRLRGRGGRARAQRTPDGVLPDLPGGPARLLRRLPGAAAEGAFPHRQRPRFAGRHGHVRAAAVHHHFPPAGPEHARPRVRPGYVQRRAARGFRHCRVFGAAAGQVQRRPPPVGLLHRGAHAGQRPADRLPAPHPAGPPRLVRFHRPAGVFDRVFGGDVAAAGGRAAPVRPQVQDVRLPAQCRAVPVPGCFGGAAAGAGGHGRAGHHCPLPARFARRAAHAPRL
ncbi:MAG: CDP-diacylglycerol--serine O-phosphatidyltransferase, partial [uncultured Cytophagales bacterium]